MHVHSLTGSLTHPPGSDSAPALTALPSSPPGSHLQPGRLSSWTCPSAQQPSSKASTLFSAGSLSSASGTPHLFSLLQLPWFPLFSSQVHFPLTHPLKSGSLRAGAQAIPFLSLYTYLSSQRISRFC